MRIVTRKIQPTVPEQRVLTGEQCRKIAARAFYDTLPYLLGAAILIGIVGGFFGAEAAFYTGSLGILFVVSIFCRSKSRAYIAWIDQQNLPKKNNVVNG